MKTTNNTHRFLSLLGLSTALCLLDSPSWAMKIEENILPKHTQKKKEPLWIEIEDTDMNIISTFFPSQKTKKSFQDLPASIIGKIGDELDLKSVHSLKAASRRTRAYLEVYSCYKLTPPSQNERAQYLRQRLQNDDLPTFLRLLTHMTPLELREDAATMLATAENNFAYRQATNPQERQITSGAFHKQATLLKLVETYGTKTQKKKTKSLLKNQIKNLWEKVNQSQNQEETLFWLNLIGQKGRMDEKIQVHQWCHEHPLYAQEKQTWFEIIEKNAHEGSLLDRFSLSQQYQKGTCGFPTDEQEATYWLMKAGDLLSHSSFDQIEFFLINYILPNSLPQQGFFGSLFTKSPSSTQPIQQGILIYWLEKLEKKAEDSSIENKRDLGYLYERLKMPKLQIKWEKKLKEQVRQEGMNGMRKLASWYQKGHKHLPKNPVKAKYWQSEIEKKALNGSLEDKRKIAYWYAEGHYGMPYDMNGVTRKNPKKADEWFKRVAEEGTQEDKLFLAFAYAFGYFHNLVPHDLKEASYWYEEAFKNELPRQDGLTLESSRVFLEMLRIDITQDTLEPNEKLIDLITPAKGEGHPHAQYYWALKCIGGKNYQEAVKLLEKAKRQGFGAAAYQLGIYYKQFFNGLPEMRLEGMIDNFTVAAQQDHPLAHRELGWLHEENRLGGIKDPLISWERAIAHYKYAALYGVKSAYERGKNLERLLKTSMRKRF